MGSVNVIDIIDRATVVLNDTTKTRWPDSELLGWYNDAQRAIIVRRPDANAINTTFSCALSSQQALPEGALRLIDVIRNETLGTAITNIAREVLDQQNRGWHSPANPVSDVRHFIYDDRNPKIFYLFPVPVSSHSIRLVYSMPFLDVVIADFAAERASPTTQIPMDDTYQSPLIDFILYRAFSKDAEYAENAQRAVAAMSSFESSLGTKTQVDSAVSPNG